MRNIGNFQNFINNFNIKKNKIMKKYRKKSRKIKNNKESTFIILSKLF